MNTKQSSTDLTSMIIEGFICPECQLDLTSADMLRVHFELVHLNTNKQQSNKSAKSNQNTANPPPSNETTKSLNSNVSNQFLKQYFNQNQLDGLVVSHTNEFKRLRDNTIGRYVIQTNKLLITLDKLTSVDLSTNENERDAYYKSIVSWIDDKDVPLCPNCGKTFNILFRKHHCRLCGAVMCSKCSQFISFHLAKQLTEPDSFLKQSSQQVDPSVHEFKLRRADSLNSLSSYVPDGQALKSSFNKLNLNAKSNKQQQVNLESVFLRLCQNCGLNLERKYKFLKGKIGNPAFTSLYDELFSSLNETQRLYPVYTKMAESLNMGETVHQLSNAEELRQKLIRIFQHIEAVSARILNFGIVSNSGTGTDEAQNGSNTCNDQRKLQQNIRVYSINYLKEHSFNMSKLPTLDEYEKLKKQRKTYLIEELRRTELEQRKQRREMDEKFSKVKVQWSQQTNNVSIDNSKGWIPIKVKIDELNSEDDDDNNNPNDSNDDGAKSVTSKRSQNEQEKALRIQIQLVEGYLQEAIKHKKHEEAKLLQQNLNELLNELVNK